MNKPKKNYFSVNRSLLQSDRWLSEPFTRGQAWVDLFGLAQHTDGYFRVRGIRVNVKRGQLGYSQVSLAKRWRWSRNKVRRYLKELEKNGDIEQQNNEVTTLIIIKKYNYWQGEGQQTEQQTEQQKDSKRNTYNKDNKDNKEKNTMQTEVCEEFNSEVYIKTLLNDPKPHIALIGRYFKIRGLEFPTKEVAQAEIKRWVKDASYLSKYNKKQIDATYNYVVREFPEHWNLSTMRKYIANPKIWN